MLRLPLISFLVCLLLTGCGGAPEPTAAADSAPDGQATSSSAPTTPPPSRAARDRPVPEASPTAVPESLDFSATTVGGEPFEGADLAGRATLLWFWAPWCPTCRSQIPEVEGYAADHADDLQVIGVGSLDSADAIAAFADEVEGVTHLEDTDGELYRRFGIAEQSSFVLLDESGEVAFETGYGGSDELAAQVAGVLG